jgi:hypothetical protein
MIVSQDHTLATICSRAVQLEERAIELFDQSDELSRAPQVRARVEDEGQCARQQAVGMAGLVADMPAEGISGLLVKARLIVALSGEADDEHGQLASSVARDLLRLLG